MPFDQTKRTMHLHLRYSYDEITGSVPEDIFDF